MRSVNAAYDVLSNTERRNQYDLELKAFSAQERRDKERRDKEQQHTKAKAKRKPEPPKPQRKPEPAKTQRKTTPPKQKEPFISFSWGEKRLWPRR
jgi:curved DNA-binding protein CbpA